MKEILKYKNCFVCGDENRCGLKVKFFEEKKVAKAEYVVDQRFEGYKNVLHGGIISTLLDEVMIKAVLAKDLLAVTAQIEVKFKKPVMVGEKLFMEGRVKEKKGRIFLAEGKIINQDGVLVALGSAKYVAATEKMKELLEG
ncbi:MAG: hypothetical protein AMJ90_06045, partial [candidate division Zixibacteria bacterium SM23_73_2]